MSKPRISCFRYKNYTDIYVKNVSFSNGELLSTLDILPEKKIIALIESDADYIKTVSAIGKNIGTAGIIPYNNIQRYIMLCKKTDLIYLLNKVDVSNLDGLFITSINNCNISENCILSLEFTTRTMMKRGDSDISVSINFPENEMVISALGDKYDVLAIKDEIQNFLEGSL